MKKYKILIALITILIPNLVNAKDNLYFKNNNDISITKTEYINLVNLGFSENEILNMTKDEYMSNRDLDGNIVSSTTKYYKNQIVYDYNHNIISKTNIEVSEDEYFNSNFNETTIMGFSPGYTETIYNKVTTNIISVLNKYRYKVSVVWKSMPSNRSYDIIGIGIDSDVYIYSDITFQQNYSYNNGVNSSSNFSVPKKTSTGGAAFFPLPTSTSIISMESYLYFTVDKVHSGTLNSLYAYGDYSHATSSVSSSNSSNYSINQNGINLFSTIYYNYDAIPVARAHWTGTW